LTIIDGLLIMKFLPSQLLILLQNKAAQRNFFALARFFFFLLILITAYSFLFHIIMLYEGRQFTWITGFYWTLTVMSTLGFGDITFHTDLGLIFTMFVLLSGVIFFLIMLPFTFIQYFYAPWLEAQAKVKTPRTIPEDVSGHVIITNLDAVTKKLIKRLNDRHVYHVLIVDDLATAERYRDWGYNVVVGVTDNPKTYLNVRVAQAAMVVVTEDDLMNTNIAFTIREITKDTPIVTNADNEHSIDILEFPGNMHVFQFMKMLGYSMGQRTVGIHNATNIIGRLDNLQIAEIPATLTNICGRMLRETGIREKCGVNVVGIWQKGKYVFPAAATRIEDKSVLLLAGTEEQLQQFDRIFSPPEITGEQSAPVLILGGGRVGHAAAEVLDLAGIEYSIIEKRPTIAKGLHHVIQGDAADINVLKEGGIDKAGTVLITTHHDPMNIYLTFYCRQLRPDIQIVSRAAAPRTVNKLHVAGADLVMSYATMAANSIMNLLYPDEANMVLEGLILFQVPVPQELVKSTLLESNIREQTGCSVIAIRQEGGDLIVGPDPVEPLSKDCELIMIGAEGAEDTFHQFYN